MLSSNESKIWIIVRENIEDHITSRKYTRSRILVLILDDLCFPDGVNDILNLYEVLLRYPRRKIIFSYIGGERVVQRILI